MWLAIGLILLSGSANPENAVGIRQVFNNKEKCVAYINRIASDVKDESLSVNTKHPEARLVCIRTTD